MLIYASVTHSLRIPIGPFETHWGFWPVLSIATVGALLLGRVAMPEICALREAFIQNVLFGWCPDPRTIDIDCKAVRKLSFEILFWVVPGPTPRRVSIFLTFLVVRYIEKKIRTHRLRIARSPQIRFPAII